VQSIVGDKGNKEASKEVGRREKKERRKHYLEKKKSRINVNLTQKRTIKRRHKWDNLCH
jgi:hypothetical protein